VGLETNHQFEIVRGQELLLQMPLAMAEVWALDASPRSALREE
jgi:hypothetical protein